MPPTKGIRAGKAFVELFADSSKLVRGLRVAERKLRAFGDKVKGMGTQLLKVSALFSAPLVVGVKVFADFETQMAEVSTLLDDSGGFMDEFRKGIRRMSVEFGQSTETLARGLFDILSASIPASEAMKVLEVSAKLATAGLSDTGTTADAITTLMNAYGLSAGRAADLSDLLFQTAKQGKTTLGKLAPNIGKVATLAASASVSLEEMGASIATLTRAGLQTEDSITALRAVIASFLTTTDDAAAAAKKFGFELSTESIKAEGLLGIFRRIADLSPEKVAEIFPNLRAITGVLPALARIKGFANDIEVLTDRAGATERAFKKLAGTLSFAFRQVKQSVLGVLSVIGEALAGRVRLGTKIIKVLLTILREWISQNKAVFVTVAKVILAIGGLGVALVTLGTAGIALSLVLALLPKLLAAITFPIAIAAGVFGLLKLLPLLISPIGAIIAIMGVLAFVFVDFGRVAQAVMSFLKEKFGALRDFAIRAFQGMADAIRGGDIELATRILWLSVKLIWEKGFESLRQAWLSFGGFFLKVSVDTFFGVLALMETVSSGLQLTWLKMASSMGEVWVDFMAGMRVVWSATQTWLVKRWLDLFGLFGTLTKEQVDAAKNLASQDLVEDFREIEASRVSKRKEIDEDREKGVRKVEEDRDRTLAQIGTENLDLREKLEKNFQERRKRGQEELAKAQLELESALGEAREKRLLKEEGGTENIASALNKLLNRLSKVTSDPQGAAEARGRFVAANVLGLQAGSATNRMVNGIEKIEKNTRSLRDQEGTSFG